MPRYVLLRHECSADYRDGPHWDLMVEQEGKLRTWSLLELPAAWNNGEGPTSVAAAALPDHRRAYLDYEGEVSGNRGSVKRVANGTYESEIDEASRLEIKATGDLEGTWQLTLEAESTWRLATGE